MTESVKIRVGGGKVTVEAAGVEGPGCLDLVKPFEEALGAKSNFEHKPEFSRLPHMHQNQDQEAGQ